MTSKDGEKRIMFKSLKGKILVSMIMLTSLCSLIFIGVSVYQIRTAVTNQMKNDGENLVTVINREISKYDLNERDKIDAVLKKIKSESKENIKYISLADINLNIVASSDSAGSTTATESSKGEKEDAVSSASTKESKNVAGNIKEGKSAGYIFKTESGEKVYNVSTAFYNGEKLVGTISIGISLNVMNEMITKNLIQTIIISLIVQVIAVIIGIIMSKRITTPITRIIDKLDDFSKGDFTIEFTNNKNDETRKLTDALNKSIFMIKQTLLEMKDKDF